VSNGPRTNDDGSITVRARLTIPAEEIELRATTSGGPGGQHANRSLTRVVASFRVEDSRALSEADKQRVLDSSERWCDRVPVDFDLRARTEVPRSTNWAKN
jgi:protein subunit release factor B